MKWSVTYINIQYDTYIQYDNNTQYDNNEYDTHRVLTETILYLLCVLTY